MPSPFPGMNPYFEQADIWQDFHTEFLTTIRRLLIPQVGRSYIVQIEEHVYIHDTLEQSRQRLGTGDVSLAHSGTAHVAGAVVGMLEAPVEVELPAEAEERIRYLEILDRRSRELVTIIELLSPSNKRAGDDREQYLARRRGILRSAAHLVEIDLLRGFAPMPLRNRPACDYSVVVSRAERRPRASFWAIRLRERLPVIPIPLKSGDGDAQVDLQEALHSAYDGAGYETHIYGGTPEPALSPDDRAWAAPFVPAG